MTLFDRSQLHTSPFSLPVKLSLWCTVTDTATCLWIIRSRECLEQFSGYRIRHR